jgi:hypothetical protein
VDTTPGADTDLPPLPPQLDVFRRPVQAPPFTLTLTGSIPAAVHVLDADGRPVRGGNLQIVVPGGGHIGGATVGSDGVAHPSFQDPGRYSLFYSVDPLGPRLIVAAEVEITDGGERQQEARLRLREPRWLSRTSVVIVTTCDMSIPLEFGIPARGGDAEPLIADRSPGVRQ